MKIEHLTNSNTKIGSSISSQLSNCVEFSIATAFIGSSAIDLIEQCLKENNNLKSGKLLVGVYGYFNLKSNFIRLKNLAKTYPDKFTVHISRDKFFHWKFYLFENKTNNIIFVGSANFTNGGMTGNNELVIKLTDSLKAINNAIEKLKSSFVKQWHKSGSISKFPIDFYPTIIKENSSIKLPKEFNDFFTQTIDSGEIEINETENAIVFYLTDDIKASSYKKIFGYNSTWEKNNIPFLVCNGKSSFQNCLKIKKLLIITRAKRNEFSYYWANVTDSCDEVNTDDGKYFIAYKVIGKEKRLSFLHQENLVTNFNINLKAVKHRFINKVLRKNQLKIMEKILSSIK